MVKFVIFKFVRKRVGIIWDFICFGVRIGDFGSKGKIVKTLIFQGFTEVIIEVILGENSKIGRFM